MATTTFTCNKDARIADNGSSLGAGASDFNPMGLYSGYLYRTLLGFSYSFSGMVQITSAILHIRTSTQFYVAFGSDPDIYVRRLSASWSEGTSVGLSGTNAVEWSNQPGVTGSTSAATDISTAESTWDTVDITTMMEEARAAGVFYGLRLWAVDEGAASDVTEIYSREQGSSDPYISVTYSTNVAPNAPITLSPTGGGIVAGGVTPLIEFTHSDNDGDALLDWDLQVSTDNTFASVTHLNIAAQTGSISGNDVNYTYAGTALTRGSTYYWRARTSAAAGVLTEGAWTAAQSFKVNQLPVPTFVTPSAADALVEMTYTAGSGVAPRMVIRWNYSDADGGAQLKYQVVVLTDASGAFWDSGLVSSAAGEVVVPVDPTRGDFYRVTVTVTDQNNETGTTGQRRCKAQWAVQEYKVDLGATVTAWNAVAQSTAGPNKLLVTEYASSATGTSISTWYSTLASAALARWFHWRVYLFAWSGASTPQMEKMSLTYTSAAGVPPDGWTVNAQCALDTGTRVYGTQSLKITGNGTNLSAYQSIPVEKNTDYILSGRIKSDGNSDSFISIVNAAHDTLLSQSPHVTATQGWTRTKTPIWNSGENESCIVKCEVYGAGGTFAWFDAIKMEASRVVTPWTPGFVGTGVSIDVGGLQIDASPSGGAVMRLLASDGGARDRVELGSKGLLLGGDAQLWSPAEGVVESYLNRQYGQRALNYSGSTSQYYTKIATGVFSGQYQTQSITGHVHSRYDSARVSLTINTDAGYIGVQPSPVNFIFEPENSFVSTNVMRGYLVVETDSPVTWSLWVRVADAWSEVIFTPESQYSNAATDVTVPLAGSLVSALPGGTVYQSNTTTGYNSFPANPWTDLKWWRKDLNMEFFWDGTRWLSTTLFHTSAGPSGAGGNANQNFTATATGIHYGPIPALSGCSDIYLVKNEATWMVVGGTALSASHKWTPVLTKRLVGNTDSATVSSFTIDSGALSNWFKVTNTINALMNNGTTHYIWAWVVTKTGTPGTLYFYSEMSYRYVAT
jgi:hypothetical protein